MKLPKNLASRYTQMTDQEMGGDAAAGVLLKSGMLKSYTGGNPGPISMDSAKENQAMLRPGIIKWNDTTDAGVSFNLPKGKQVSSAANLDLSKILQSRYVQQDISQGRDVREFAPKAPTPATPATPAKADAVETVKAAAKVEADATALAAKAKATKDKALEGLGYYLGEEVVETEETVVVEASTLSKHKLCIGLLVVGLGISLYCHFGR